MNYQVVHAIEGRIRIRIPQLAEENFGQQLKSQIEQLKAVKDVRINLQATSIVVTYRDRLITDAAMQEELHQIIEQLIPPDPLPTDLQTEPAAPSSEPATAPDASPLESNPAIDLDEDVWADSTLKAIVQDPPLEAKVDPELDPELDPETLKTKTAKETPPPESADCKACSTSLLAKRLGVSIQAINLRRSKPEFAVWSQTRDPDGIAWSYQEASKVFVPVQTNL